MLSGGPGRDIAYFGQRAVPVRVTIGAGANDGVAGEGDDVHADVEDIQSGRGNDVLRGNAGANRLFGDAGRDQLHGGRGNDVLSGGAGSDRLDAREARGSAAAQVGAQFVDQVMCGDGEDTAFVDPTDTVDPDCENVVGRSPSPPQNNAPTAVALSTASLAENQPAGATVGTLSASDPDPGDTHSFALVPGAVDNGSFQIVGSALRTAAVFDYETKSSYTVRVLVTDSGTPAGQIERDLAITVTDANDPPAAVDDNGTVGEDSGATAIPVLANDTDVDGGAMTIDAVGDPANGTVVITGGGTGLTYQPDPDYCDDPPGTTPDAFPYTLNGGSTATVSITVTCVNDPPIAVNDSATVVEDAPATAVPVLANDTDVDGGPMTIGSASDPANGTVVITGGGTGLSYQPDPNYCNSHAFGTPDTFTYTLNGGSTATVSMTVTCTNEDPVVDTSAGSTSYTENDPATPIDAAVTVVDPDPGPITGATIQITGGYAGVEDVLALAGSHPGITPSVSGDTLTLTGGAGPAAYQAALRDVTYRNGSENPSTAPRTVTFTVTDDAAGTGLDTKGLTVVTVDDPPVAVNDSATVVEDAPATAVPVLANDTDVDGGAITIGSASDPANGTVVITGGGTGLTYQPDPNYCSATPDTFTYTLSGGSTATVSMTVTCVPEDPVVDTSAGSTTYTENDPATPIDSAVTVSDPDAGATITGATVQITGGYTGAEDVLALAGLHPGITPSLTGDTLTLTGDASPAAYRAALRDVTYRNDSDDPSTAARTVTFMVTDETAGTGSDTKGVTVVAVDDPPVAVNDSATVLEDAAATAVTVLANDTDVDGGPKTINSASDPANGTVVITGGGTGLTYQPDPNYCNDPPGTTPDTFTYTLNGGSTATVSITVTCVNDAPVADDETFNGANAAVGNTTLIVNDPDDGAPNPSNPKKTISGDILAGDADVDGPGPLTVTAGTFATNDGGSVTIESDGDFTFQPAAGTSCTDTSDFFDYTVEDSGSPEQTDTGTVTIQIAGCVWYVSNNAAGNSGTSTAPFDTLAQAETASGNNHTVFVFDGDNTATGYGGDGYAMNAGERLIGEHEGLVVGADTLHPANAGAHPTLTATNADVIDLDDGNELRGLNLDPQGAGGGIAGGAGDTGGGTIDDVNVTDGGTTGAQPGLELNGTTGTFNVTNLAVNNSATGVLLTNAGTTDFGSTTITSASAPGLVASATNMSTSTFGAITVTGSGSGGVSLANTTGATTFGDLALTMTSGSTAAFGLSTAGTVSVPAAGTANISATGGPAVDATGLGNGSDLAFDTITAAGTPTKGVNLDGTGNWTFSAGAGSSITGATTAAFDVNGGSGAVTYAGSIANGTGEAVDITGRTGNTTISGNITGTGGTGINVANNTAGTTTFSGTTKNLNTGTVPAVSLTNNTGHTIGITNGGLNIDTTTGNGFNATGGGTVTVTGAGNTLSSTTGTALNVANTTIGAADLNFHDISANGGANGIVLNATGTAGGLTVTGDGTNNASGGLIQNTTGSGILLTDTQDTSLTSMKIDNTALDGIDGTLVTNFSFVNGTIDRSGSAAVAEVANIGFNTTAAGTENNADGTITVTGSTLLNSGYHGLDIFNFNGTLSNANLSNNTITSSTSTATSKGSAIRLIAFGSATTVANITRATIDNNMVTNFPSGAGIQVQGGNGNGGGGPAHPGTVGTPGSATDVIAITNNDVAGQSAANRIATFGIAAVVNGHGQGNYNISGNDVRNTLGTAISVGSFGFANTTATVNSNVVVANNTVGAQGIGMGTSSTFGGADTPTLNGTINSNTISQTDGNGILATARDANGTANFTIESNNVSAPLSGNRNGIRVDSGNTIAGSDEAVCLDISGNTTAGVGLSPEGIGLRKQGTSSTVNAFGVEGMAATASPGVEQFVDGLNTSQPGPPFGDGNGVLLISATSGFTNCNTAP